MPASHTTLQVQLAPALRALRAGDARQARDLLRALTRTHPAAAEVHWLLAGACVRLGDLGGAEAGLATTLRLDPTRASAHALLGEILARTGRNDAAAQAFRQALARQPDHAPAAANLASLLLSAGQPDAALAAVEPLLQRGATDPDLLLAKGQALLAMQQPKAALPVFEALARRAPAHAGVIAGLAAALLADGRAARAAQRLQGAMAAGADSPELHFLLAHAALAQGDADGALTQLRDAVRARPHYLAAQRLLCETVWTQSGDPAAASAELDRVLAHDPAFAAARILKAQLLESAGESGAADTLLQDGLRHGNATPELATAIAQTALKRDAATALRFADLALGMAPDNVPALAARCAALMGTGHADIAAGIAERLHTLSPGNSHFLALLACAWRMLGDARYATLGAPDLVLAQRLDTPPGWPALDAYLADLGHALNALHTAAAHPIGQSLRTGSQVTLDFARAADPAIHAFPAAIAGPLHRYLAQLGSGDDPFRKRNTGGYRVTGAWSVRLRPHGFHTSHVHPEGWISSACYIELPARMDRGHHEGGLQFGQPGFLTSPALAPDFFVSPSPGLLVLFPSCMWHGTVPFAGPPGTHRTTLAFDVVPAPLNAGLETAGTSKG